MGRGGGVGVTQQEDRVNYGRRRENTRRTRRACSNRRQHTNANAQTRESQHVQDPGKEYICCYYLPFDPSCRSSIRPLRRLVLAQFKSKGLLYYEITRWTYATGIGNWSFFLTQTR
jgi:hypothetical protein